MIDTLQTVSSFLTPATLFILLNLVIATIVLSSRHHHHHHQSSHHPPDPMSGVPFSPGAYHHFPLLRTTSPVLERLRSFTLHRFRSGEIPSPTDVHACSSPTQMSNPNPNPTPIESEPTSMAVNGLGDQVAAAAAPLPPPPLARTSSILDKLKSINLYRFRSGEIQTEEVIKMEIAASTVTAGTITEQHYGRSQSESVSRPAAKKKTVKKIASIAGGGSGGGDDGVMVRQRRPSFRGRDVAVEEEVNARADDFINRFKEQLKIQRLNSILNYKEMLNRGS